MEQIELNVHTREESGSGASRKMRKAGMIPAVVYSEGEDATSLTISEYDYQMSASGNAASQLYTFKSENKDLDGKMVIIRDAQIEPVRGRIQHIDFLAIKKGHKVRVTVPIELVGECAAIRQGFAVLSYMTHELDVECLPKAIPTKFELDISGLELGDSLHAGDVSLGEGVELRTEPNVTIVSAVAKQAAAEPAAEDEEAAEGEAEGAGEGAGSDASEGEGS